MDVGPIPWHHAVDYAERLGFDAELVKAFVKVIRHLDGAWLAWKHEESEKRRRSQRRQHGAKTGKSQQGAVANQRRR